MPGNTGPIAGPIGEIVAFSGADESVVELDRPHRLDSRMLVRLRNGPSRLEGYVKPDPQSANRFQVYNDREFKQAASLGDFRTGANVELLNAEDWAVVAGVNFYPGLQRDLQGPVLDGDTFKFWALDNGYVPNCHLLCALSPSAPPQGVNDAHPTLDEISKHFETMIRRADEPLSKFVGQQSF